MEPMLNILVKSDDKEIASQATDALRFATAGETSRGIEDEAA